MDVPPFGSVTHLGVERSLGNMACEKLREMNKELLQVQYNETPRQAGSKRSSWH